MKKTTVLGSIVGLVIIGIVGYFLFSNTQKATEYKITLLTETNEVFGVLYDHGEGVHPPDLEKEGHDFLGWFYVRDDMEYSYTTTPATQHKTLYPKFEPIVFTVDFDTCEGSAVNSVNVNSHSPLVLDIEPTKEGHAFMGWYYDSSYEEAFAEDTVVLRNVTLYAKWEIKRYSIQFETGSEHEIHSIDIGFNEPLSDLPSASKEGYTFEDWYLDEAHTERFSKTHMPAHDVALYARFEANTHRLTMYRFEHDLSNSEAYLQPLETVIDIYTGGNVSFFVTSQRRVLATGANDFGQLGDGTYSWSSTPRDITHYFMFSDEETILSMSVSTSTIAAITSEYRVFTWGNNNRGQLADGTTTDQGIPRDVTASFGLLEDEYIIDIALGLLHGIALSNQNRVFTWGNNAHSQLGNNSVISSHLPYLINDFFSLAPFETIVSVTAGFDFSAFYTSTNRIFVFGRNHYGQLGLGDTLTRTVPVTMSHAITLDSSESVVKVEASAWSMGVLTSLGNVWMWGYNSSGKLGDNTQTNRLSPVITTSVFTLSLQERIIDIQLGLSHTAFITNHERVFLVGDNTYGQLGDGTFYTLKLTPYVVSNALELKENEIITQVRLGGLHTFILTSEHSIYGFGYNEFGQIASGSTSNIASAQEIPFRLPVYVYDERMVAYNSHMELPHLEREGFMFQGWKLDMQGYFSNPHTDMPNHDLTLFSRFSIIHYSIDFHLDGGTSPVNYSGYHVLAPDIAFNHPHKEGFLFDGYYTNADYSGEEVYGVSTGSIGSINVYAKWISPLHYMNRQLISVGDQFTDYTFPYGTNETLHTVSGGYAMAAYETTYELWHAVKHWAEANGYQFQNPGQEGYQGSVGALPKTRFMPVGTISWYDTIVWLNAFSELSGYEPVYRSASNSILKDARDTNMLELTTVIHSHHNGFRLPTSMEWEMAARYTNTTEATEGLILAGDRYWTPKNYASGATSNSVDASREVATFIDSFETGQPIIPLEVGLRRPNALGIYDMNGNVNEWVFDVGARSSDRVLRGGSASNYHHDITVSRVFAYGVAKDAYYHYGFRVVKNA